MMIDDWLMERRRLVDHVKMHGMMDHADHTLADLDVALRMIEAALEGPCLDMGHDVEAAMQAVLDGEEKHGNST